MIGRLRFTRKFALAKLCLLVCGLMILMAGCSLREKSAIPVRHYSLEYASPVFGNEEPVKESIRIEALSISKKCNGTAMVYRKNSFVYGDDAYNRWRVRPSDMISDLLIRDMRNSGLFRGVFSPSDSEDTPYILGGTVEEFYEIEEESRSKAVLALNIFLIDTAKKAGYQRMLFQKNFRAVHPLREQTAESLAGAASRAMETISNQIIRETFQAIRASRGQD